MFRMPTFSLTLNEELKKDNEKKLIGFETNEGAQILF